MKLPATTLALLLIALPVAPAAAQQLTEAWRATGFMTPESVSYDAGTNAAYVSNINSPDMSPNGQGYITKLGLDGKVIEEKFAEGLNAPKGTFVADGKLWVAGVEELVEIDLATGDVVNRYAAPGATFLNDVAVAENGTVYVTETMQGAIYVLSGGTLSQFVADPALAGANGIEVDGNALLVATLGDLSQGFENLKPSNVKRVDIASKAVADYGSADPVGMLDGIEKVDGGVIVTDNGGGRVVMISDTGMVAEVGATGGGSADFEYVPEHNLVLVPNLQTSEVVAYTWAK